MVIKRIFEVSFEKNHQTTKKHEKLRSVQRAEVLVSPASTNCTCSLARLIYCLSATDDFSPLLNANSLDPDQDHHHNGWAAAENIYTIDECRLISKNVDKKLFET